MMEERKHENATKDNISLQADTLTDLPLADERADETKGGTAKGNVGTSNGIVKIYCAPGDPS